MADPKITEKRWDKEFEAEIWQKWMKEPKTFKKDSKKPTYSIDTPPPYVNTPIHIGQATTYVLMDMFARFKRMTGHEVLFPLGLDRNGLPIEVAAEKKFKVDFTKIERKDAVDYCQKLLQESSLETIDTFAKLGISFNSFKSGDAIGDVYFTDSEEYRKLTQETFIDLWNKGLIYEDERINNWDPKLQTTIADSEIDYKDINSTFNDIVFKCKETGEDLIIGTTRPELVCTCGMVIFNPEDDRYKHLEGKTAVTPVFEKAVKIKSHPLAQIDKGTGLVMMCSAGDLSDIQFFREMKIDPTIAINMDGTMNEHAGFLEGLAVKEARKKMIESLQEKELLVKQTPCVHRTPISERSKAEIEFISMKEFYLKQIDQKDKMTEIAKKMNFFADKSRKIMLDWIESVSIDWPISRRRFYATEIPLWNCKKCGEKILGNKGKYHQPWKDSCPVDKCKCGSTELEGETRVFDTWFDSSISPLYILKYTRDDEFFKKSMPCSLRPQGKEIIRTWLYYTALKCYLLTDQQIFNDVWINYHIVDEKGYKMSKSVGNVIDPQDVISKFGSEPFRLWTAVEGNLEKTDFKCSYDRIEGAGKTLTKLWNVSRFISMFPEVSGEVSLRAIDKWVVSEMNKLVEFSKERFENYDFHNPGIKLKNFLWETFASHYLELVKSRAYNPDGLYSKEEQNGAVWALNYCLSRLLRLLSPITPMVSSILYDKLYSEDVHSLEFPLTEDKGSVEFSVEELMEINSLIWKTKKDGSKSLRDSISKVVVDEKFKEIEKDLVKTHNIESLEFGELSVSL